MARNTDKIDYRDDYYRGISAFYFNKILETIIEFGLLKDEPGAILDYGCGVGHLKKKLNSGNVVGYDIIPELSDIDDFKSLKPAKIVASNVLEHMYKEEIDELLITFLKMNPSAPLLVSIPTENLISRLAMKLNNCPQAHDDHVTDYKTINNLIEKFYYPEKRKYIFFRMSQVTKYIPRRELFDKQKV